MAQVAVMINGKTYRMACDEGQEAHLLDLAKRFDGYIGQLRGSFGEIGDQRLTVMAGVMVTDELVEVKKQVQSLQAEVDAMKADGHEAPAASGQHDVEIAEALASTAKRIEKLSDKLNGKAEAATGEA